MRERYTHYLLRNAYLLHLLLSTLYSIWVVLFCESLMEKWTIGLLLGYGMIGVWLWIVTFVLIVGLSPTRSVTSNRQQSSSIG